jgi:eukaryotic-like serine/threonine-protein kinase
MQAMGGLSGRQLADYRLGAQLGNDGFGAIYEAHHLYLDRVFALRVLSDQFTFAQGFEEQFWRVTQVLSKLEHANLLTLDDYGMDGPYAYLVTPLMEGLTLEAWLRSRPGQPVHPAQVLRLFGQMLAGLGAAHQAGVTHLGLTPSHILVQPNGHLFIAHLGLPYLAEQLWIAWNGSRSFGDPFYLAPEQMAGRTPDGVAADVYALGVILYRLLTGALPFEGPPQALLNAKLAGPPPLRAKQPNIPEPLEALARRALAPAPANRWESVAVLGGSFYQVLGQANPLPSSSLSAGPATSAPLLLPPRGETPSGGGARIFGSPPPAPAPPSAPPVELPALKQEGSAVVAWSSAGRGRIGVPPPPPSGQPERPARPPKARPPREHRARLLGRAAGRVLIASGVLFLLCVAVVFGYAGWVRMRQHNVPPTPTAAPSPTPTPKPRLGASGAQVSVLAILRWKS